MKKIAIPLENGRLCAHFGHCQQFSIVDVDNNAIVSETRVTPPPHEPGLLPAWLAEKVSATSLQAEWVKERSHCLKIRTYKFTLAQGLKILWNLSTTG